MDLGTFDDEMLNLVVAMPSGGAPVPALDHVSLDAMGSLNCVESLETMHFHGHKTALETLCIIKTTVRTSYLDGRGRPSARQSLQAGRRRTKAGGTRFD